MKFLLTCLLLAATSLGFSQSNDSISNANSRKLGKQEFSLNAFNLVAFGIVDITYERIISENSTWAIEAFYHPSKDDYLNDAYYKELSLTGKYKHFFSSKYASGFYVHGFGMLSNGEYEDGYYYDVGIDEYIYDNHDYTDFAIGFGLGGKFVSKGGFLLDLSGGIGRNLFSDQSPTIVGQFMVNLGYRF